MSEPLIGLLVTVFATTVVILTVPLAALTKRVPRRTLIVIALAVLAVSCVLTAIAPNYPTVVATRILGGAAHGVFWSVVGAYAGHLVPKEQLARAVSISVAGGSLAFVLGVPLGTALGQAFGWRLAFAGIGVLTLLGAVLVQRFLPPVRHHAGEADAPPLRLRSDPTFVPVIVVCLITSVTMVGAYTFYTYVAPFITNVMAMPASAISPLLLAYGIAGALGLVLSGTVLGRRPTIGLAVALLSTALGVAVLALFPQVPLVGCRGLPALGHRVRRTAAAVQHQAAALRIGAHPRRGRVVLHDGVQHRHRRRSAARCRAVRRHRARRAAVGLRGTARVLDDRARVDGARQPRAPLTADPASSGRCWRG